MKEDERELKQWLVALLPEGWSRQDVADELRVERKTVSSMLNPNSPSFGQGRTLIRYLQLVGGLQKAPAPSATSRLGALEAKVDLALVGVGDILDLLREAPGESGADGHTESRS